MRVGYLSRENVSVRQRTESAATTHSNITIGGGKRLLQAERPVVVLNHSVALARRIFEALAVEDF